MELHHAIMVFYNVQEDIRMNYAEEELSQSFAEYLDEHGISAGSPKQQKKALEQIRRFQRFIRTPFLCGHTPEELGYDSRIIQFPNKKE